MAIRRDVKPPQSALEVRDVREVIRFEARRAHRSDDALFENRSDPLELALLTG
jgi:hypothetical protein